MPLGRDQENSEEFEATRTEDAPDREVRGPSPTLDHIQVQPEFKKRLDYEEPKPKLGLNEPFSKPKLDF